MLDKEVKDNMLKNPDKIIEILEEINNLKQ
jgi:hypothetical protein